MSILEVKRVPFSMQFEILIAVIVAEYNQKRLGARG